MWWCDRIRSGEFRTKVGDFEMAYGGREEWAESFPDDYKPLSGLIPSELFIAGIGGCASMHIMGFCKKHNLKTDGVQVELSWEGDAAKNELIHTINIQVKIPDLPENLEERLIKMIRNCTVAKSISLPPKFDVNVEK